MKQVLAFLSIGAVSQPLMDFITKYIYSDFHYLIYLILICGVDTLLGIVKAVRNKNISSKGFSMVFNKLVVYGGALVTSHILVSFTIHDKNYVAFSWFDSVVFSAIMAREALSVFENIALIAPDAFPKWILKYLRDFDSLTGHKKIEKDLDPEETDIKK